MHNLIADIDLRLGKTKKEVTLTRDEWYRIRNWDRERDAVIEEYEAEIEVLEDALGGEKREVASLRFIVSEQDNEITSLELALADAYEGLDSGKSS